MASNFPEGVTVNPKNGICNFHKQNYSVCDRSNRFSGLFAGQALTPPWLHCPGHHPVIPDITGKEKFNGKIIHTCSYKNGVGYEGKIILVVGCGNLANYNAKPSMVARNDMHVLPLEDNGFLDMNREDNGFLDMNIHVLQQAGIYNRISVMGNSYWIHGRCSCYSVPTSIER